MRTRSVIVAALLLSVPALAMPAGAKDICVSRETVGSVLVFKGVKKLKPGKAMTLAGFQIHQGEMVPVSGTAIMESDGTIEVAVEIQAMSLADFQGENIAQALVVDSNFVGSGKEDTTGDGIAEDSTVTWLATDCKTVQLP